MKLDTKLKKLRALEKHFENRRYGKKKELKRYFLDIFGESIDNFTKSEQEDMVNTQISTIENDYIKINKDDYILKHDYNFENNIYYFDGKIIDEEKIKELSEDQRLKIYSVQKGSLKSPQQKYEIQDYDYDELYEIYKYFKSRYKKNYKEASELFMKYFNQPIDRNRELIQFNMLKARLDKYGIELR